MYGTIDYTLRDVDPIGIRINIHNRIEKYFAVHSMELKGALIHGTSRCGKCKDKDLIYVPDLYKYGIIDGSKVLNEIKW